MHDSTIVLLINDNARALKVEYEDGGSQMIVKTLDQSIQVDDLVVVQSGTRHFMTVAKVVEADFDINYDTQGEVKWIVQKIDRESFQGILDQENKAIDAVKTAERNRKRKELQASVMANHEDTISSLAIADMTGAQEAEITESEA